MLDDSLLHEINQNLKPNSIIRITPLQNALSRPDSTKKYSIQTTYNDLILMISSEVSPLLVKRAVDRQRQVKAVLHGLAAKPIELPVLEGCWANKSYAVWIKRQPQNANGIWSKIDRILLAPQVYRWLRDLAAQTVKSADPAKLLDNVQRLLDVGSISASVKAAADKAQRRFCTGEIPPVEVVQHSDLWIGNILKGPSKTGFIVIDWAGARTDGSPYFDLVKFALSTNVSKFKLRNEIAAYSKVCGCDPRDATAYVISGLGALHSNLEYFPESEFIDLCQRKLQALNSALDG
jgi:hypothetical protein